VPDLDSPVDIDTGRAIALGAVLAYLSFVGASAALAPPLEGTAPAPSTENATVVGLQGPFAGDGGRAVLVAPNGSVVWRSPETAAHFDVTPLDDGRVLAAVTKTGQLRCGRFTPPCARVGYRVYDPGRGDPVVREWTYPVRDAGNSEVHDAEPLPDGGVLVAGMEHERVFVVRNGSVTWEWRAATFYDRPDDPTRRDWLHINDVDRIGPGRYLVSVRNANQLVVLERDGEDADVTEVVNADAGVSDDPCTEDGDLRDTDGDGDVRCGDPAVLDEQHNPQWLGDGRVLVADSENDRVVELRRRTNGTWTTS